MEHLQQLLKTSCKDGESYKKLQVKFEEILLEKEKFCDRLNLLERVIESDYDSILITSLNLEKPGPTIVYVNQGFTKMTGYKPEEVIGKSPRILQGPKTDRAVIEKLKMRLKSGQSFFGHTVNYRKDGSEFINQWDIHPLINKKGEITHWVSYQHDITERKRSEEKVVDSQIEFDNLAEESRKTILDINSQGTIISSNKCFRNLVGYDNEELKTFKFWDIVSEKTVSDIKSKFIPFDPEYFNNSVFNFDVISRTGKHIEVQTATRLITVDDEPIIRACFENKSLQKKIVSRLKKQDSYYNNIFDSEKDFRYKLEIHNDGHFPIKFVSDSFKTIVGSTNDIVVGTSFFDFIHPDDLNIFKSHLNIVSNGTPNTIQFRLQKNDGDFIRVIDYAKPVWNKNHTVVNEIKGATSIEISSESHM